MLCFYFHQNPGSLALEYGSSFLHEVIELEQGRKHCQNNDKKRENQATAKKQCLVVFGQKVELFLFSSLFFIYFHLGIKIQPSIRLWISSCNKRNLCKKAADGMELGRIVCGNDDAFLHLFSYVNPAHLNSIANEINVLAYTQLVHDSHLVRADRLDTAIEFFCYLGHRHARDEKKQNLFLPL